MDTFAIQAQQIVNDLWAHIDTLALPIAIFAAALALAFAYLRGKDKQDFDKNSPAWNSKAGSAIGWFIIAFTAWTGIALLQSQRQIALVNLVAVGASEYADAGNALYQGYYQSAPYIASFHDTTYSRNYQLPSALLEKVKAVGADSVADSIFGSEYDFKAVANSVVTKGSTTTLVRTITREEEDRQAFAQADVNIGLKSVTSRKGDAFQLTYKAVYKFSNPQSETAKMRFRTSLPETEGTIDSLSITVNGTKIDKSSEDGTYEWLGTLGPNADATAEVSYRLFGAGSIDIDVAETLRPVQKYNLTITSPINLKFGKRSLQPTSQNAGSYTWNLDNAVSHNGVSILVPAQLQSRQVIQKLFAAAPLIFLAFALTFLIPSYRPQPLRAWAALAGVGIALAVPMALAAVIAPLLAPVLAAILIAVLGFILGGKKLLTPAIYAAALSLTVLIAGFTTLSALMVTAAFIAYTVLNHKEHPVTPESSTSP